MQHTVNEKHMISPFLVFILIHSSMIGVGILNYQRQTLGSAGFDAWVSVLLMGVCVHLILWFIYKILGAPNASVDITAINRQCFGQWIGGLVNLAIVLYFILGTFIVFRVFIEVIQVWLFPEFNFLPLSFVILLLLYYSVSGGFRAVTGLNFWGILIPYLFIIPLILTVLDDLHPRNLMPVFNHTLFDIVYSVKDMTFQYLGFEAILLFYPFIKHAGQSQKWAHSAVFSTTALYLVILLISFMYYNEQLLPHIIWPTLNLIMMVEIPLMQRLEYFIISVWLIKVVANLSLSLWAACRTMKGVVRYKQRVVLFVFIVFLFLMLLTTKDWKRVEWISEVYTKAGFYFVFAYIPLVFLIVMLKRGAKPSTQQDE